MAKRASEAAKLSPAKIKINPTQKIRTVTQLINILDQEFALGARMPGRRGNPRESPDEHAAHEEHLRRTYTAQNAARLADAARDVLTPAFRRWAKEQEAPDEAAVKFNEPDLDAGPRHRQAEQLRWHLTRFLPELQAVARQITDVVQSGSLGHQYERDIPGLMERVRPGDKHVFALQITPVDMLFHKSHDGYDVTHGFYGVAEGTSGGSYSSDVSWERRGGAHPVLAGALAECLWAAMAPFTPERAAHAAAAQLVADGAAPKLGDDVIDKTRAVPESEHAAATWNIATVQTAVELRKHAADLRAAAIALADGLEVLADSVSRDTWPRPASSDGDDADEA